MFFLAVIGLLLTPASLCAGEVAGLVVDGAGAPLSGVVLRLSTAERITAASTETSADGRFRIAGVPRGSYVLTASRGGFSDSRAAAEVPGTGAIELRLILSIRPLRTEITIGAEAGAVLPVDSSAQAVTKLNREDLDRASLLSNVADGVAGVQQLRTSPTLGAFFVRGFTGKNVAVFRDNIRYTTSAQRGGISTFLNLLQPNGAESVEVLRGPNSAQYGSDSLGGTVAVVSRTVAIGNSKPILRGELTPTYESASHAIGTASAFDYSSERFGFRTDLIALRSSTLRTGGGIDSHAAVTRFLGLPSTVLGTRLPDTAFTSYGGTFHSQLALRESSQIVAHYERSHQDGGKRYDQLLGGDGNLVADLRNLMLDFGYLRYQRFGAGFADRIAASTSFNAQREERVNQGGQGNPLGAITHQYEKTRVWGVQFNLDKRAGPFDLAFGGEGYRERIAAPSFSVNPGNGDVALVRPRVPDGARYWTHGLYGQSIWKPLASDRLRLAGAVRFGGASYNSRASRSPLVNGQRLWPNDSLSANAVTGRVGAAGWITSWLSAHAHFSRGFRTPNVTDLGTVGLQGNGAFETAVADLVGRDATIGDRADDQARSTGRTIERLRPEFTNNYDFGLRIRSSRLTAEFTAFRLTLDNSIVSQTLILPQGAVGQALGEQTITRQLPSGAVFVPISTGLVLVRANFAGARMRGFEHDARVRMTRNWSVRENLTYLYAEDVVTKRPPDLEPGVPPLTANLTLAYHPAAKRYWFEAYALVAGRQQRLSSLALSDRRIGNPRSRANIQSFFNNGARVRGLVANNVLVPTGETLAQVQNRVLGAAASAPQFSAIPGYGLVGVRGGINVGERTELLLDLSNLADKNYRGIGWGVDGPGRNVIVKLRYRF
ncbi:MAG: TonB-dependent receptor [Bryobacterales bacterium]|nr:TonB-dependent receptor [Bryobacterales bacterium]